MKRILFFLSLLFSAVTYGQNLGAPIYASQNKPNNGFTVYNKSFWKDITTDWTATGVTLAKNADSSFRIPTGASDFTKYAILNGATNTDENIDFEIIFKPTALTAGIAIGRKTTNTTFAASLSVDLDFSGATTFLKVGNGVTLGSIYSASIAVLPTANDMISLTYSQRGNVLNVYYRNLSTGLFAASPPIISNLQPAGVSLNWIPPNTGDFCIWNYNAGPTDVQSIKITSFSNPNPKILWVGDSKTSGIGANYLSSRSANLCKSLGSMSVMAGDGDKTSDVLADTAYILAHFLQSGSQVKYVILNIGRNDISNGVSSAVYEANYDAIVAFFKRHGVIVIHLLPIPEVSLSQTTLTTYITTTYAADAIVDPSIGWVNGTDVCADNVHPSPAGYRLIANQVKANTAIRNNNDQFEYPPFPNNSIDIPLSASQWITTGSDIYYTGGNVGIGRAPTGPLDIFNNTASVAPIIQTGLNTGAAYLQHLNNLGNGIYVGSTGSTWATALLTPANWSFIWGTNATAGIIIQTTGTGGNAGPINLAVNGAIVASHDITGHYVPGVTLTSNLGSASLQWKTLFVQDEIATGAKSNGHVNVSGTGTYSALGTDYTIEFTGTTATLAYPTVNLVNGRHLNIVNYGSGALTIPSTKTGNASTITTLASNGRLQVEYDLGTTTWIQIN